MKRIKLTVAYDGTDYCGWQIQPNGITVEEVLNREISRLTGEDIHVMGASRTDSGVHALGNVAVFDTESRIPPERIAYALNQRMPEDIVIVRSEEVPEDWHPRYQDEITKTYEYHIYNGPVPDPIRRRSCAFVSFPLDVKRMRQGAAFLVGEHDFVSFCNVRTNTSDTVRTVHEICIDQTGNEIVIRISGNGFLYNMVRIIAGTLIRVGRGFYEPEKVREILEAKKRTEAGVTAPPQGLVLVSIQYGQGGTSSMYKDDTGLLK
jgi:tRNA pseudouridine38-40 synthase